MPVAGVVRRRPCQVSGQASSVASTNSDRESTFSFCCGVVLSFSTQS